MWNAMWKVLSVCVCLCITMPVNQQAWAQEVQGERRVVEERLVPPKPEECREVFAPEKTFKWSNYGGNSYFKNLNNRQDLIRLAEKPELVNDLREKMGFSLSGAMFIKEQLQAAKEPWSEISEIILPTGTSLEQMMFGKGVVRQRVLVDGPPLEAWQMVLPRGLGAKVLWIAKPCGNIAVACRPAHLERTIRETEVREVQVPVVGPAGVQGPPGPAGPPGIVEVRVVEVQKKGWAKKWLLVPLAAAGAAAATYFIMRDKNSGVRSPTVVTR